MYIDICWGFYTLFVVLLLLFYLYYADNTHTEQLQTRILNDNCIQTKNNKKYKIYIHIYCGLDI